MGAPRPQPAFGIDDFLAWEAEQSERHEYLGGEVFAMTDARDAHNTIADMELRIDAADAVCYPDVLVTCDARDRGSDADTAKRHPALIVAVPSASSAAYHRGLKFELYRGIDSLREYLLIEQDRRHVDLFRREADGRWLLQSVGPDGSIDLDSVATRIDLRTIYEDVDFSAAPA